MAEVEDAYTAGNAAFKAGDNEEAVRCFTEAIRDDPTNEKLYSNRSAANAKLCQFKDALLDANKCIDLKPDWFRGHSRRGAAYFGLKSYRAALGAFEEGLKLEPTNAYMLEEAARMRKILTPGNAMPSSSGGMPPPPPPPVSPTGATGRLHGVLSVNLLIFTTMYVLPFFPRRAAMNYRLAVGCAMLLLLNSLAAKWPKAFATLKDPAFLQSDEVRTIMLCLMMLVSPPLPFALMPYAATALHTVCLCYGGVFQKLPGPIGRAVVPRAQYLTSDQGTQMVQAFGAVTQVIVCLMSPMIVLAQGLRAGVLVFFYFQYVARRHSHDYFTQQAVTTLTENMNGIFHHKWCPSPIGMLFDRLKGLVALAATKVR